MTCKFSKPAAAVLLALVVVSSVIATLPADSTGGTKSGTATGSKPVTTPPPAAASPAKRAPVIDMTTPGARAIDGLSFLSGKWKGELRSLPFMMDISIDGGVSKPGKTMSFDVQAKPSMGMSMPIDGNYRSTVNWSETKKSLRVVTTDASGRGVEMAGGKLPDVEEWLFSTTEEGAPFPFKVRIRPVTGNQVVVAYSSSGRFAYKCEVTFNRVEG